MELGVVLGFASTPRQIVVCENSLERHMSTDPLMTCICIAGVQRSHDVEFCVTI
jgi:hypothetical protein